MATAISPTKKRRKVIQKNPNPLFEKWITEWKDEATNKGWKTQYVYSKALRSLQRYPLKLESGKEAKILEYFGDKICDMLDQKLSEYRSQNNLNMDSSSSDSDSLPKLTKLIPSNRDAGKKDSKLSPNKLKKKEYIPIIRSGAYAILITLYEAEMEENKPFMKKADLQEAAQHRSDTSFTVPLVGSRYTAWSSMGTLVSKKLVEKEGNPAKYCLSDSGKELAFRLFTQPISSISQSSVRINENPSSSQSQTSLSQPFSQSTASSQFSSQSTAFSQFSSQSSPTKYSSQSSSNYSSKATSVTQQILKPGNFTIILCVDNCEVAGGSKGSSKDSIVPALRQNGVPFEVRKLHVGDFLWIAKEKVLPLPGQLRTPEPIELVLDYVIERKRIDDLAQSIKDGRFHEQKFRLSNSGVRRPMYLVEAFGSAGNYGLPNGHLRQAISNTQIINNFLVKMTKDLKETIAYLTLMTRQLERIYGNQILLSCTKETISTEPSNAFLTLQNFNNTSIKNKKMTAKEMFIKQLLQINGISVDKVKAITDIYSTPAILIEAYENQCNTIQEREKLLSTIKSGQANRNLGPTMSKVICQLYTQDRLS